MITHHDDPRATPDPFGASVFGLKLTGEPLQGAHPAVGGAGTVTMTRASLETLGEHWRATADNPVVLYEKRSPAGQAFLRVERDERAGFRIWCLGLGEHLLSPDGTQVASQVPDQPPWFTRRLMAAQVLPLAAALQGREVLHAAAVALDGHAIALVGESGAGKTSTAAHLLAGGAGFAADDGLALWLDGGRLRAFCGPRMLNLDRGQYDAIAAADRPRLGEELGRTPETGEVHLEPATAGGELRPAGLVRLTRVGSEHGTDVADVGATDLLRSFHVAFLTTPDRLLRQFDVAQACSSLPTVSMSIGTREDAPAMARRVAAWARSAISSLPPPPG